MRSADNIRMELSPELALVDEELAQVARGRLRPRPPVDRAPIDRRNDAGTSLDVPLPSDGHRRASGTKRRVAIATTALLVAAVLSTPGSLEVRSGSTSRGAAPSASDAKPASGIVSEAGTKLPKLTWREVGGVTLYNVILVDGDRRVDFWSSTNELTLPRNRSTGESLQAGSYDWYVYPGHAGGRSIRYGEVLAHGTVVVPDAAR